MFLTFLADKRLAPRFRQMKVAYVSEAFIPSRNANSVQVMKMCHAFARNGHDVTLLAPNHPHPEPGISDTFRFYGVDPCFGITRRPWLPVKGRQVPFGVLTALKAKGLRPDLVYGRSLVSCLLSARLGLPVVFECHEPPQSMSTSRKWMFDRLTSTTQLRRIVLISRSLKDLYREYGVPAQAVVVAHDGADEPVAPVIAPEQSPARLKMGYVGNLYAGRGLEMISDLATRCPWADLHIVGGFEQDLSHWRQHLDKLDNVIFHGFVPPSETDKLRSSFDVLLAPYQRSVSVHGEGDTSRWMSPLKIFEYMAAGKPIVCSDLPVLREVLENDKTALLCDPDRLDDWVEAFVRLRDDPDLRRRLGETARLEFLKKYTWRERARKVLEGVFENQA